MKATVISDASFCNQDKSNPLGGWAAWVRVDGWPAPIKGFGTIGDKRLRSSSDAEVMAALNGMWLARRYGGQQVLVRSDCMTVVDLIEGRVRSERLLAIWRSALQREDMQGITLRAQHVKGHGVIHSAATWVNDWCDRNAKNAMRMARKGQQCLTISDSK